MQPSSPKSVTIITLSVQTLAYFDLENKKEMESTRAKDGLSAAQHFVDRHPLPDNPASGTVLFTNACFPEWQTSWALSEFSGCSMAH